MEHIKEEDQFELSKDDVAIAHHTTFSRNNKILPFVESSQVRSEIRNLQLIATDGNMMDEVERHSGKESIVSWSGKILNNAESRQFFELINKDTSDDLDLVKELPEKFLLLNTSLKHPIDTSASSGGSSNAGFRPTTPTTIASITTKEEVGSIL